MASFHIKVAGNKEYDLGFLHYDVKAAFDEFREIYEENKDGKIECFMYEGLPLFGTEQETRYLASLGKSITIIAIPAK